MALQILRDAMLREDYSDDPPGDLRLLDGAPRHWFQPGQRVAARRMATFFGTVSFEVVGGSDGAAADLTFAPDFAARRVTVRLPLPDGRPIRSATVDGRTVAPASDDEIVLERPRGRVRVEVQWK
ncbi:MAG: hypothetical protein GX446_14020, partial [Chthonomonadales bacterium]|nr:hypothetical protein [Chthonomonadales bacterium]